MGFPLYIEFLYVLPICRNGDSEFQLPFCSNNHEIHILLKVMMVMLVYQGQNATSSRFYMICNTSLGPFNNDKEFLIVTVTVTATVTVVTLTSHCCAGR